MSACFPLKGRLISLYSCNKGGQAVCHKIQTFCLSRYGFIGSSEWEERRNNQEETCRGVKTIASHRVWRCVVQRHQMPDMKTFAWIAWKKVTGRQLTISHRRMTLVPGPSEDTSGWMLYVPTVAALQTLPKWSSSQLGVKTKKNTREGAAGCSGRLLRWLLSRKEPVLGSKSYLQKLSRYTHSDYWYLIHLPVYL